MKKIVVDASIIAKWFNIEEYTDKAVKLKDAFVRGEVELCAPIHLIYEVGNSLWKNRQLTIKDACEAIVALMELGIELVEPTPQSVERIMEIARIKDMSFYDAAYVQLAEELNIPLITADEKQLKKSRELIKAIHIKDLRI